MKTKSIVLFGDSLLGRFGKTFIDKLEAELDHVTVYNCAAGGWNTADGVKRVDFIAKLKPDYVVISFGANDAAPWKKQVPEESFENNLNSIIDSFSGSKIIIFPCPSARDSSHEEFNKEISRYNKIVHSVAKDKKTMVIDSNKVYGDLLKEGKDYNSAGVHLNDFGYDILIKEIAGFIS